MRDARPCLESVFPVNCDIAHEETLPTQNRETPAPATLRLAAHPAEPPRQARRRVVRETRRAAGPAARAERLSLGPRADARFAAQIPDRGDLRSPGCDGILGSA